MDRYLITVQAVVTVALMGFALFMYTVVGGAGADQMGALIVGAVITHWFKESATIARKAASIEVEGDDVTVAEKKPR